MAKLTFSKRSNYSVKVTSNKYEKSLSAIKHPLQQKSTRQQNKSTARQTDFSGWPLAPQNFGLPNLEVRPNFFS